MCRININITNTTTPVGTTIVSAQGRYKGSSIENWNNFSINLLDPKTPDITVNKTYILEISVTNNLGHTSEWVTSSFIISEDCAGTPFEVEEEVCESTQPYAKFEGHQKLRYTQPEYTKPNFNMATVQCGQNIRLYINFSAKGNISYNVTFDKTYTTTEEYATVFEWFNDQVEVDTTFKSFVNSYTRDYGFSGNGLQFFVHSHRNGTASRDVNTNVSLEFGRS